MSNPTKAYLAFLVPVLILVASAFSAAQALAAAPQWSLTATSSPTNIVPGSPVDEVQELTVDATGGTFTLTIQPPGCPQGTTVPIAYNTPAFLVGLLLETTGFETPCITFGDVQVSGGPGGSGPYLIKWVGNSPNSANETLGDNPVPMSVDGSSLTGSAPRATVTELTAGEHTPRLVVIATNVGGGAANGAAVPIVLKDGVPPGLVVTTVTGEDVYTKTPLTCSATPAPSCSDSAEAVPGDLVVMEISLQVPASGLPTSLENKATVTGGGAPGVSRGNSVTISATPAAFGVAPGTFVTIPSSSQAGTHPNLTTSFVFNTKSLSLPLDGLMGTP